MHARRTIDATMAITWNKFSLERSSVCACVRVHVREALTPGRRGSRSWQKSCPKNPRIGPAILAACAIPRSSSRQECKRPERKNIYASVRPYLFTPRTVESRACSRVLRDAGLFDFRFTSPSPPPFSNVIVADDVTGAAPKIVFERKKVPVVLPTSIIFFPYIDISASLIESVFFVYFNFIRSFFCFLSTKLWITCKISIYMIDSVKFNLADVRIGYYYYVQPN